MCAQSLHDKKRTPLTVIREAIALRRNGHQLKGLDSLLYNQYWYLWVVPRTLFILFLTRPLAVKGLPLWAKWRERSIHAFWSLERRFLPRLTRPPLDQALVRAVSRNELHNVEIFLQRGAKPDQNLARAMPLLPYIVHRRNTPIVRLLLEAGAKVDVREAATGETSLLRAVKHNDSAMVALLLQHGAHVDTRGYLRVAPVVYAARTGYTEVVRLLIEHGADPTLACPDGNSAEDYARKYKHAEIVELCAAYRERSSVLSIPVKATTRPIYRTGQWCALSAGGPLWFFYRFSQDPKNLFWLLLGVIGTNLVWRNGVEIVQQAKLRKKEEP